MVDRPHPLHRPVGDPLGERPVACVEPVGGRGDRAVGVRAVLEDAPHDAGRRRVRAGAVTRERRAGTRRSSSAASPRAAPRAGRTSRPRARALQIVTRRPWSIAQAPMCGESARTRRQRVERVGEVELAVGGRRSSRHRSRLRPAGARTAAPAARRRGDSTATSAERAKIGPASSVGPIAKASCAAIGPASSALTVSWIVTPVVSSPARIARSTGAAPRQRGSSDGWTLSQSELARAGRGDQEPVGADDDRVDRVGRQLGPLGLDAPGCRGARRPPSRAARASLRPRPRGASGRVSRKAISWLRRPSRSSTSAPKDAVAATAIRITSGRSAAAARRAPACGARRRCGR